MLLLNKNEHTQTDIHDHEYFICVCVCIYACIHTHRKRCRKILCLTPFQKSDKLKKYQNIFGKCFLVGLKFFNPLQYTERKSTAEWIRALVYEFDGVIIVSSIPVQDSRLRLNGNRVSNNRVGLEKNKRYP